MELWVRGNCWKNKHWIFYAALLCIDMTFLNGVRNTLWRATECGWMIYFSTGSNEEQWIIVSAEGEQSSSKAWCKYCPMSTTVSPSAPPDGSGSFLNQISHAVKWFLTKENNSVSFVSIWSIEKKKERWQIWCNCRHNLLEFILINVEESVHHTESSETSSDVGNDDSEGCSLVEYGNRQLRDKRRMTTKTFPWQLLSSYALEFSSLFLWINLFSQLVLKRRERWFHAPLDKGLQHWRENYCVGKASLHFCLKSESYILIGWNCWRPFQMWMQVRTLNWKR